jgi:hypothetical protein
MADITPDITPGVYTCTKDGCGCVIEIHVPCPFGGDYRCGCGDPLVPRVDDEVTEAGIGSFPASDPPPWTGGV